MHFGDLSSYSVWAMVAVAILVWIALALYALWRTGRATDRAQSLQDLANFLDTMIQTDRRRPIWLWPDGRLQADADTLALVGLDDTADHLDALAAADNGIPDRTVGDLKKGLAAGNAVSAPLVIDQGSNKPRLILDFQWLPGRAERWPSSILWLEESMDRPIRTNRQGVRALELRLKDLTRAFNNIPFPVWVRGTDYGLVEVNQAYVDAVDGESVYEVTEQNIELFDKASLAAARKARETGDRIRERRFGVIDGQRRAFAVTNMPLDTDGNVMGIAVDVTGEEEALSELARVLDAQAETLNRLRSPVAIFGPGQTLRFYNSAFSRLSHLPEDLLSSEIRHSELLDAMREKRRLPEQADFPQWKKNILKHYTSLLEPFEEMWHLPDGTAHRVVTQPHPLGGLLILFEDVTDRLALERSYNTLMAVQQETLDNMMEAIAVFGTDGRLQLSNPAFASLWQISDDELDGNPHLTELAVHVPTTDDEKDARHTDFKQHLAAWISDHKHRSGRWYRTDGSVIDYAIVPLPDGGVMLTQSDITDSFKVEQALRERSSALEAADRLKSEFITNMSYELRTPLNSIIGFAEMLDQKMFGDLNDQQAAYIQNILTASGDLRDLISDVLDLAVLDAGEANLSVSETNVAQALNETANLVIDLALKSEVSLDLDELADVGMIEADERRLKQAFYNMVSSMLNFAHFGGDLSINLLGAKDDVTILIINPDSGLTKRERDRLVSAVEMGASPGGRLATGLDLALVRSIVKLHHGLILLEPLGDEGLALSCTLPRTQPLAAGSV